VTSTTMIEKEDISNRLPLLPPFPAPAFQIARRGEGRRIATTSRGPENLRPVESLLLGQVAHLFVHLRPLLRVAWVARHMVHALQLSVIETSVFFKKRRSQFPALHALNFPALEATGSESRAVDGWLHGHAPTPHHTWRARGRPASPSPIKAVASIRLSRCTRGRMLAAERRASGALGLPGRTSGFHVRAN
jgi:hypothetical protein